MDMFVGKNVLLWLLYLFYDEREVQPLVSG